MEKQKHAAQYFMMKNFFSFFKQVPKLPSFQAWWKIILIMVAEMSFYDCGEIRRMVGSPNSKNHCRLKKLFLNHKPQMSSKVKIDIWYWFKKYLGKMCFCTRVLIMYMLIKKKILHFKQWNLLCSEIKIMFHTRQKQLNYNTKLELITFFSTLYIMDDYALETRQNYEFNSSKWPF